MVYYHEEYEPLNLLVMIHRILDWAGETLLDKNPLFDFREIEERKDRLKEYLIDIYLFNDHPFSTHYAAEEFVLICLEFLREDNKKFFEETLYEGILGLEQFSKYTDKDSAYLLVIKCIREAFEKNNKLSCVFHDYQEKIYKISSCFVSGAPLEICQRISIRAVIFGLSESFVFSKKFPTIHLN